MTSLQVEKQEGSVAASGSLLKHTALTHPQVCPTAFKVAENEEGYILRYYNMSQCQKDNKRLSIFWNNRIRSIQVYWHRKKSGQNGLKKKKYSWLQLKKQ